MIHSDTYKIISLNSASILTPPIRVEIRNETRNAIIVMNDGIASLVIILRLVRRRCWFLK